MLKRKLTTKKNVFLSENENMYRNGQPNRVYIDQDGYHPNQKGTSVLAGNMKRSIHTMLSIHSKYQITIHHATVDSTVQRTETVDTKTDETTIREISIIRLIHTTTGVTNSGTIRMHTCVVPGEASFLDLKQNLIKNLFGYILLSVICKYYEVLKFDIYCYLLLVNISRSYYLKIIALTKLYSVYFLYFYTSIIILCKEHYNNCNSPYTINIYLDNLQRTL
jgi:hypothetical protein